MSKMTLTAGRRARIFEVLKPLGAGVSVSTKARIVERSLGEPCTYGQALSLLSQFLGGKKCQGKTRAQINQERFERQKARRPDLYR